MFSPALFQDKPVRRAPFAAAAPVKTTPALRPVTVVTGASEGIGLALAHRFAQAGHDLLLVARREPELACAAISVRSGRDVTVEWLALDVTRPDAAATIEAVLQARGACIGVLVNNAGIGLAGPFDSHDPECVEQLLAVNIAAATRLMHHVLPGLRARRAGGILNVSSLGGFTPGPYQAIYYASRAYVISLSEAVAAEVAGDGVRVCVVTPGPVRTRFHAKMGAKRCLYRWLIPGSRPSTIASWAYWGYRLGLKLVVPGLFSAAVAVFLRLLPHRCLIPIVAWLLKLRAPRIRMS